MCAVMKERIRVSSYVSRTSSHVHAVNAIWPRGIRSYGRTTIFTDPKRSRGYEARSAPSFSTTSGVVLCEMTMPPCSRLCTSCSSARVVTYEPQGVGVGQCGPDVGGTELYVVTRVFAGTWLLPWSLRCLPIGSPGFTETTPVSVACAGRLGVLVGCDAPISPRSASQSPAIAGARCHTWIATFATEAMRTSTRTTRTAIAGRPVIGQG